MAQFGSRQKALILTLILILVSLLLYFLGKQISQDAITNFVRKTDPWSPVVYILTLQLTYILAPIGGPPFLIAGFYLFGETVIIYTYIAAVLGSTINFLIAKKWGRPLVTKFAGKDATLEIDKLTIEYGLATLVFLRLFLIGMNDFVSYAYGLTTIKFSSYITISVLAMIPGHVIWYYVSSKTNGIEQFLVTNYALLLTAIILFLATTYLIKRFRRD